MGRAGRPRRFGPGVGSHEPAHRRGAQSCGPGEARGDRADAPRRRGAGPHGLGCAARRPEAPGLCGWANRGSRDSGARNARGPEANFGAASLGGSGGPIRPIAYGGPRAPSTDAILFVGAWHAGQGQLLGIGSLGSTALRATRRYRCRLPQRLRESEDRARPVSSMEPRGRGYSWTIFEWPHAQ